MCDMQELLSPGGRGKEAGRLAGMAAGDIEQQLRAALQAKAEAEAMMNARKVTHESEVQRLQRLNSELETGAAEMRAVTNAERTTAERRERDLEVRCAAAVGEKGYLESLLLQATDATYCRLITSIAAHSSHVMDITCKHTCTRTHI